MEIKLDREMPHAADAVWVVISNFGDLSWCPEIATVESEGEGVGMIRRVTSTAGGTATERLDSLDPDTRTYSYSQVGDNPLPMKDYSAEITVEALEDGGCCVHYTARATPTKIDADMLGKALAGIFGRFFDEIDEAVDAVSI